MKHRPASEFIPSFDLNEGEVEEIAQDAPAPEVRLPEISPFMPKTAPDPGPDLDQIFENGRQAGRAAATADAEDWVARLREDHAAALEAARQAWADEVATVLAAQVPQALAAIEDRLSDTVGRLLRPFLETELRDAASRALIEQVTPLLNGTDGALIRVCGPHLLVETLRRVFPAQSPVSFEDTATTEATITVGETVIETRIEAWIARLDGNGPDRRRRHDVAA
jgi:hypothetical protein